MTQRAYWRRSIVDFRVVRSFFAVTSCVIAFAFVSSIPARAQSAPKAQSVGNKDDAEQRFQLAQEHYRNGRFAESVDILLELRREFPDPILLYNLARSYEGLGENAKAIDAYEQYLKEAPNSEDRGAVEQRVTTLRAQAEEKRLLEADRERLARQKPRTIVREKVLPPDGPGIWPWLLVGAGVASTGVGVTFAVLAKQSEEDAVDEPAQRTAKADLDRAENRATAANVALIAGGVLVASGMTWLVLAPRSSKRATSIDVSVGPNGLSLRALVP
jgi:tetratricopeptide (TPR) repeat protein